MSTISTKTPVYFNALPSKPQVTSGETFLSEVAASDMFGTDVFEASSKSSGVDLRKQSWGRGSNALKKLGKEALKTAAGKAVKEAAKAVAKNVVKNANNASGQARAAADKQHNTVKSITREHRAREAAEKRSNSQPRGNDGSNPGVMGSIAAALGIG